MRESFRQLQRSLIAPNFLVHFDHTRILVVGVDVSKERGYGVEIYHVKGDVVDDSVRKSDIQHVMFLSKVLNGAESRYWSTEMKVACLVWTVKKIRHLIEASKHPAIIYTDHSSTAGIANQTSLSTSSTDKLNLRPVRASQYLSQFSLDIRHRAGKPDVVPDALSSLTADAATVMPDLPGLTNPLLPTSTFGS